jgi:hypothetical protein
VESLGARTTRGECWGAASVRVREEESEWGIGQLEKARVGTDATLVCIVGVESTVIRAQAVREGRIR